LDKQAWRRCYKRHQQEYKRKRLRAIKLAQGQRGAHSIAQELDCSTTTLRQWYRLYLLQGLDGLIKDITHEVKSRLDKDQQQALAEMLIEKQPCDYGLGRYMWTADLIRQLIELQFGVIYQNTGVYKLLDRMGFSHQKAHCDYTNASLQEQQQFIETLKKSAKLRKP